MRPDNPDQFFQHPWQAELRRRFIALCVTEHGDAFLSRIARLDQPADPARLEPVVKEWLRYTNPGERHPGGSDGVIPDIWSRCTAGASSAADSEEEDERERGQSLASFHAWPGWYAMLSLFADVPLRDTKRHADAGEDGAEPEQPLQDNLRWRVRLIEHLIGTTNKKTGMKAIEAMRALWLKGDKPEARKILGGQLKGYFRYQRDRLMGVPENQAKNMAVVAQAIRRLYGERMRRRGAEDATVEELMAAWPDVADLAAELAEQVWRREFALKALNPMERYRAIWKRLDAKEPVGEQEIGDAKRSMAASLLTIIRALSPTEEWGEEMERNLPMEQSAVEAQALAAHVRLLDEHRVRRCVECEECPTALTDEERGAVKHKFRFDDQVVVYPTDAAYCGGIGLKLSTFKRRLESALAKLKRCLIGDDGE